MSRYEIRVAGQLSERVLDELRQLELETRPVETVMLAPACDDSRLHGVLDALQDLGLRLVAVQQLPD